MIKKRDPIVKMREQMPGPSSQAEKGYIKCLLFVFLVEIAGKPKLIMGC